MSSEPCRELNPARPDMVSFKRFNASRYSQIQSSRILRLVQIDLKKWFKRRVVQIPAKSREVPAPRLESVTRRATPECPHPGRWSALDAVNPEIEVLDFMRTIVMTIKPELVVQTGARNGVSSIWLAEGLKVNGIGVLVACDRTKRSGRRPGHEHKTPLWRSGSICPIMRASNSKSKVRSICCS
jgi:hypothetical protein